MWSYRKEIHKQSVRYRVDAPCYAGMDVVFLIDYTWSMAGVIEEVKNSISSIASTINTQSNPNSYRLSLVICDEYNKGVLPTYNNSLGYTSLPTSQKFVHTSSPNDDQYITAMEMLDTLNNEVSFTTQLNKINTPSFPLGQGSGGPEPTDVGIDLVVNNSFVNNFKSNVARYIILFTDALPGGYDDSYDPSDDTFVQSLTQDCITKGIKVIVLGNGASYPVWQNIATGTGGSYNTSYDGTVVESQLIATCEDLVPPIADAGIDQSIMLPTNSVVLDGSNSSDSDGTIVSYSWSKLSGGIVNIVSPTSAITNVDGLKEGSYTFELLVTDNNGLTDTDSVNVTVSASTFIYDGVVLVNDCSDTNGQNTLVDNTGNDIGDTMVLQGTSTPFNGGSNWYRLTLGGTTQFYNDFNSLVISNYLVQVDNTGTIIDVIPCQ